VVPQKNPEAVLVREIVENFLGVVVGSDANALA
jgi:hypothetical protein